MNHTRGNNSNAVNPVITAKSTRPFGKIQTGEDGRRSGVREGMGEGWVGGGGGADSEMSRAGCDREKDGRREGSFRAAWWCFEVSRRWRWWTDLPRKKAAAPLTVAHERGGRGEAARGKWRDADWPRLWRSATHPPSAFRPSHPSPPLHFPVPPPPPPLSIEPPFCRPASRPPPPPPSPRRGPAPSRGHFGWLRSFPVFPHDALSRCNRSFNLRCSLPPIPIGFQRIPGLSWPTNASSPSNSILFSSATFFFLPPLSHWRSGKVDDSMLERTPSNFSKKILDWNFISVGIYKIRNCVHVCEKREFPFYNFIKLYFIHVEKTNESIIYCNIISKILISHLWNIFVYVIVIMVRNS